MTEKLTRHGVRDLNHLGGKRFKAEALRDEAIALTNQSVERKELAARLQRCVDELKQEVLDLRLMAEAKLAEAEALCPR